MDHCQQVDVKNGSEMSTDTNPPVCIRMCIVNLSLRAKPLPQTVHSNALLPEKYNEKH